jgi:pectate lyase
MKVVSGRWILIGAVVIACIAGRVHALPVIPGGAGYGMDTPAGRGGAVYRVTNLNASGTGSLKACVDVNAPRTCIFEVSGVIKLTTDMSIKYGHLTIAGQTAPSPGIMIRGGALSIHASDILIQHLRFRVGDDAVGPWAGNRDSFKIEGTDAVPINNVVVDHCSFSWSIDELASVWGPNDNITFSNNIFSEPLDDSIHPTDDGLGLEKHGYGVILDSGVTGARVTMRGNLFAHIVARNPLARSRELVFVNNMVYDRGDVDLDLEGDSARLQSVSVVGNQFLKGPSYNRATRPIFVRTGDPYPVVAGSKLWLDDNYAPDTGSTLAQILSFTSGDTTPTLLVTSRPVWNTGMVALKTANSAVYDSILKYAGARPADRDSADLRAVSDVKNRTGQVINCIAPDGSARCSKNAGGWPTYAVNQRPLTLPANQATITASGYSNLELWLQQLDQQMQGVVPAKSPSAPMALVVL